MNDFGYKTITWYNSSGAWKYELIPEGPYWRLISSSEVYRVDAPNGSTAPTVQDLGIINGGVYVAIVGLLDRIKRSEKT